jgi:Domain of unknown function (DUF4129)
VSRPTAIACLAIAAALAPPLPHAVAQVAPTSALPSSKPREASRDDYRNHLLALTTMVEACAKARTMAACDPAQVGPDDEVPLTSAPNSEGRLVRYGWLRVLISKARDKDAPPPKAPPKPEHDSQTWEDVRPIPPTTTQLLKDAETRLAADLAQAGAVAVLPPGHAQERAVMKQVLSGREFSGLEATTPKESALEKFGNFLNDLIEKALKASARAPWLGRVLVWGFVVAVCIALVWGLLQLERRWRIRLVPEGSSPAPGAASAIPWQVWLEDARRAAASGQWREAIHFLYWASISRLESKRLWPADRARTPREYLALVAPDDPRQPGLATLTGSFERVWYGGRPAAESDYRRAEQLASALISGSSAPETGGAAQ